MRKALAGFLLLLSVTTFAVGDLSIDVPQKTKVYEFVKATVKSQDASTSYLWKVFRRQQIEAKDGTLFTVETRISPASAWVSQGKLVFVGPPGEYRVNLMAVSLDATTKLPKIEETDSLTTIEGEVPPPPPPPPPTDEFTKSVAAAYAQDSDPTKATKVATLASVYKAAIDQANNTSLATAGDLMAVVRQTSQQYLADTDLPTIRKGVLQVWMQANLPRDPATALTSDVRKQYAAAFGKIYAALNSLASKKKVK